MRDKAVISRIAHRGVEKPVDLQCAAFLVHLVLDRLAADRHLNDDVDIVGSILADRYSIQVHVGPPESPPPQVAVIRDIGVASFPSYRRSDHSAKAECDSIALLTAKGLARSAQNPAARSLSASAQTTRFESPCPARSLRAASNIRRPKPQPWHSGAK